MVTENGEIGIQKYFVVVQMNGESVVDLNVKMNNHSIVAIILTILMFCCGYKCFKSELFLIAIER